MQVFDVEYSQNGLRDFLIAHGGLDYFDEIEVGEDVLHNGENYYRTVLRKDGAEIPIDITQNSSGGRQMWINNASWDFYNSWTNAPHSILKGYVTDSAIVFIPRSVDGGVTLYGCPLIICKSQKGYPCVIHGRYEFYGSYVPWPGYDSRNMYENTTCCIMIYGGVKSSVSTRNVQNNRDDNILTTSSIPGAVDVAKDVYYVVNRPFYQTAQPFSLDIDGESYASFAYNTILIKTT